MPEDTAREIILSTAEKLFAENGYDSTSTASIAKAAGVNSALIFYYFGSKEKLLKSILSDKMMRYRTGRPIAKDAFASGTISPELIDQMVLGGLSFLKTNENVFRIMLMELLKKSSQGLEALEINHEMMKDIFGMLQNASCEREITQAAELRELFFMMLPMVAYTLFKDKLMQYYSVPEVEMDASMAESLQQAYIHIIAKDFGLRVIDGKKGGKPE